MYHLDKDDVYLMDKPIKIYLFKEADEVKISFRITDYVNFHREMSIEHFQYICDNWRTGVEGLETKNGKYFWYYSDCGPRPECVPAKFVQINVGGWSFRISVLEMESVVEEFNYQKNNKMHWDQSI